MHLKNQIITKLRNKDWIDFSIQQSEDYDGIRNKFILMLGSIEPVIALYEFGKVKNPGISDIDLAIVLSNSPVHGSDVNSQLEKIYSDVDFSNMLCGGTIMIFSEKDFQNLLYLDDIEVNHLYGKNISLLKPDLKIQNTICIMQVFDWLPERLLSLSKSLNNDLITTKSVLGYLYSIRYTFKILAKLSIVDHINLKEFINSIEELRNNWFKFNSKTRMNKLFFCILEAYKLGWDCLWIFSSWHRNKFQLKGASHRVPSQFLLTSNSGFVMSDRQGSSLKYLNDSLSNENFIVPVPFSWMLHWLMYASYDGYVSNKIDQNLQGDKTYAVLFPKTYTDIIEKRIDLCNEMALFLSVNKINKGLYKFGWFYNG